VVHPDLLTEPVFREELVIASAPWLEPGELFAPRCKILVKAPGCAYRARLEAFLDSQGVCAFSRLEFGTLDSIIGCVEAGLGITLLPRSVLSGAADAGRIRLHKIDDETAAVTTLFIQRREKGSCSALRAFADYVHNHVAARRGHEGSAAAA
jgi:LysR family transcriptional regulator, cell division regulator